MHMHCSKISVECSYCGTLSAMYWHTRTATSPLLRSSKMVNGARNVATRGLGARHSFKASAMAIWVDRRKARYLISVCWPGVRRSLRRYVSTLSKQSAKLYRSCSMISMSSWVSLIPVLLLTTPSVRPFTTNSSECKIEDITYTDQMKA